MSILGGPGFPNLGTLSASIDLWHNTNLFPQVSKNTAAETVTPGVWAEYHIVTKLDRDRHTFMMGITSPLSTGNQAAFVKLAMDTVIMTVEWDSSSFGEIPWMPDPEQVDPRWILLHDDLSGLPPTIADDGSTPLYTFKGTFWYGLINPSAFTYQDFVIPRYPWLQDVFLRAIPSTAVQGGIIQETTATLTGRTGIPAPSITPEPPLVPVLGIPNPGL